MTIHAYILRISHPLIVAAVTPATPPSESLVLLVSLPAPPALFPFSDDEMPARDAELPWVSLRFPIQPVVKRV